ncbi:hypothetical protein KEM55_003504 [Ascosphaera atra]|nr:hypothetical protein KEM55_003504 [Ascosphaera atra]
MQAQDEAKVVDAKNAFDAAPPHEKARKREVLVSLVHALKEKQGKNRTSRRGGDSGDSGPEEEVDANASAATANITIDTAIAPDTNAPEPAPIPVSAPALPRVAFAPSLPLPTVSDPFHDDYILSPTSRTITHSRNPSPLKAKQAAQHDQQSPGRKRGSRQDGSAPIQQGNADSYPVPPQRRQSDPLEVKIAAAAPDN